MVKQAEIGPPRPKLGPVYQLYMIFLGNFVITLDWVDRFELALPFFHTTLQVQPFLFTKLYRQRALSLVIQYVNTWYTQNGKT